MSIVRTIARPLLATGFVVNGVDSFRNSSRAAQHLTPALTAVERAVPQAKPVVANSAVVAQGLAAAQVAAALAYGAGKFPRAAATVLVTTTGVNAYLDFRASEHGTKEQKAARRSSALKNVSLVGATMLAAVDTDGKPSLAWRAEHLLNSAQKSANSFGKDASKRLNSAQKSANSLGKDATKRLEQAKKSAAGNTTNTRKTAQKAAEQARKRAADRVKQAQKTAQKAKKNS